MKRLLLILAAVMAITMAVGCGKNDDIAQKDENGDIIFTQDDFAFYAMNVGENMSAVVAGLGMAEEELVYDNNTTPYLDSLDISTKKKKAVLSSTDFDEAGDYNIIYYMNYIGGHLPIATNRGIKTTGIAAEGDENCSKAEDVIKAYDIDVKKEEYKTDETADGYTINILFKKDETVDEEAMTEVQTDEDGNFLQPETKKTIERIVSPAGTDLAGVQCTYKLRFTIKNGYVHGVDVYDFNA